MNYQNNYQDLEKSWHATLFDFYVGKRKKIIDQEGYICAIFMDLPKAFHTFNQDFLIAKLGTNGFETDALT